MKNKRRVLACKKVANQGVNLSELLICTLPSLRKPVAQRLRIQNQCSECTCGITPLLRPV
eukprot:842922-Pelagomonas_calceolata.AAC.8